MTNAKDCAPPNKAFRQLHRHESEDGHVGSIPDQRLLAGEE